MVCSKWSTLIGVLKEIVGGGGVNVSYRLTRVVVEEGP